LSLAFVGNIDMSIEQLVNSTEYDLFQPLPPSFDLVVMDRFACYLPGWEMPKNSSAFLTENYGFITDYLAEAFHYVFKHTNRYEEVNRPVRLGKSVEGRDEKGIKKTLCALLKILHPSGPPSDEEFEEYVVYAVECRRRVKEQMNKRKPDDEFARIQLSYFRAEGEEIVVYCPESKNAPATQDPSRHVLEEEPVKRTSGRAATTAPEKAAAKSVPALPLEPILTTAPAVLEPKAQRFTILYGDVGHSYETIFGPYLQGVKEIKVEDPYIRYTYQLQNFVRFCETVIKAGTIKRIILTTSYDDDEQLEETREKLDELKESLLEQDIVLELRINPNLHDREIRLDNGWVIKIGRGLDFYQKPEGWFSIGANDLSLRKCLETKVDIFKA
jgi:ATP-dependent Lon protease